jgi:hypothetical protein
MVKHEQNMKAKGHVCSKIQQIYLQQTVKYFEIDAPHVSTISQVKTLRSTLADNKPAVGNHSVIISQNKAIEINYYLICLLVIISRSP